MLTGSGEVFISAREPLFNTWLVIAMPAPAASAVPESWPSEESVAAARKAPAGTRARVCNRSQPESTPGILSAKNSVIASAPEVPSTHHDSVTCRAGGRSSQPKAPAKPTPNTVRYTRIPAIHANRIPITKICASDIGVISPRLRYKSRRLRGAGFHRREYRAVPAGTFHGSGRRLAMALDAGPLPPLVLAEPP